MTIKENAGTCFEEWGYVINIAQLFCVKDRIWYPINSLERQSVILEFCRLWKAKSKTEHNFIGFYIFFNWITLIPTSI